MSTAYREDIVGWAEQQVEKLQALAELRPNLDLDIEHLVEELEGMARSECHEVANYARLIIEHLLLLRYSPAVYPRRHWDSELASVRVQLARRLQGVLIPYLSDELDAIYLEARLVTAKRMAIDAEPVAELPLDRPTELTIDRLLDQDWMLP